MLHVALVIPNNLTQPNTLSNKNWCWCIVYTLTPCQLFQCYIQIRITLMEVITPADN